VRVFPPSSTSFFFDYSPTPFIFSITIFLPFPFSSRFPRSITDLHASSMSLYRKSVNSPFFPVTCLRAPYLLPMSTPATISLRDSSTSRRFFTTVSSFPPVANFNMSRIGATNKSSTAKMFESVGNRSNS